VIGVISGIVGHRRRRHDYSRAGLFLPYEPAQSPGNLAYGAAGAHWRSRILEYYKAGNADLKAGLLIALGFLVGGYFGGLWAQYLPEFILRRAFGTLLAIIGIQILLSR
jgi:hypothetical protein